MCHSGDTGEGYGCMRAPAIWKLSVPSFQFCCELKSFQQNEILKILARDCLLTNRKQKIQQSILFLRFNSKYY